MIDPPIVYHQITDQIKAGHIRRTRLIEPRSVGIKDNAPRVQEGRRCSVFERKYHAVEDTSWLFSESSTLL